MVKRCLIWPIKDYVGCAPDTFMGAGIQTCRKLIDDGWIGEPRATAYASWS